MGAQAGTPSKIAWSGAGWSGFTGGICARAHRSAQPCREQVFDAPGGRFSPAGRPLPRISLNPHIDRSTQRPECRFELIKARRVVETEQAIDRLPVPFEAPTEFCSGDAVLAERAIERRFQ